MSPKLTFEDEAAEFVLDTFHKGVDSEGYIIEQETGQRVLTPEGEPMPVEEFGGIAKGSEIFIQDNFVSILKHVKQQRD